MKRTVNDLIKPALAAGLCFSCLCQAEVTVQYDPPNLTIFGTSANNTVTISEHRLEEYMSITADGITQRIETHFPLVHGPDLVVVVNLGDGNDSLIYQQRHAGVAHNLSRNNYQSTQFRINAGKGNDYVWLDFSHEYGSDGSVSESGISRRVTANVSGGDGTDTVRVEFGEVLSTFATVDVEGGRGNDWLQVILRGGLISSWSDYPGYGIVDLQGGSGNDTVEVLATPTSGPYRIEPNSELRVNLNGSFGSDTLNFVYNGSLETSGGRIELDAHAGWGNDSVSARLTLESPRANGTIGALFSSVTGGWGNDNMNFYIRDRGDLHSLRNPTVDGGLGSDTCLASPNVEMLNCNLQDQEDIAL